MMWIFPFQYHKPGRSPSSNVLNSCQHDTFTCTLIIRIKNTLLIRKSSVRKIFINRNSIIFQKKIILKYHLLFLIRHPYTSESVSKSHNFLRQNILTKYNNIQLYLHTLYLFIKFTVIFFFWWMYACNARVF